MNPVHELRKLAAYLLAKRTEVQDLDVLEIVLAKVILDIHRKRLRKDLGMVPLFHLKPIHRLDRETAIQATERRVEMLRSERDALLAAREITCKMLAEVLPSVSWIKVVQEGPESYLAFEGNGRLAALQRVFNAADILHSGRSAGARAVRGQAARGTSQRNLDMGSMLSDVLGKMGLAGQERVGELGLREAELMDQKRQRIDALLLADTRAGVNRG